MAWTEYTEPIEILYASDVNNIKENIEIIRNLLAQKGFTVESTKSIQVNENTQYIEMFDILSNIEYNLDIISNNEARSAYYVEPKTIGEYASNKEDIWRWIQILNDMYDILNGNIGKWQYLLCTNGFPVIDGEKIITRGDFVE